MVFNKHDGTSDFLCLWRLTSLLYIFSKITSLNKELFICHCSLIRCSYHTGVLSLFLIFHTVYLNPSKPLYYLLSGKANTPSFPYCFTNFASTAFVVLRVQNWNCKIRLGTWNTQLQPWQTFHPSISQFPKQFLNIVQFDFLCVRLLANQKMNFKRKLQWD